jgi:hypothetical protein
MRTKRKKKIDDFFPPVEGACPTCGDEDARHRIFETIRGDSVAGKSKEALAAEYATSVEAIDLILEAK